MNEGMDGDINSHRILAVFILRQISQKLCCINDLRRLLLLMSLHCLPCSYFDDFLRIYFQIHEIMQVSQLSSSLKRKKIYLLMLMAADNK